MVAQNKMLGNESKIGGADDTNIFQKLIFITIFFDIFSMLMILAGDANLKMIVGDAILKIDKYWTTNLYFRTGINSVISLYNTLGV